MQCSKNGKKCIKIFCMYVRLASRLHNYLIGLGYYNNVFEIFSSLPQIVLFSDYISLCNMHTTLHALKMKATQHKTDVWCFDSSLKSTFTK